MSDVTGLEKYSQEQAKLEKDLEAMKKSGQLPPANIVVAGVTGVGKSTLLNAIFGDDVAKTGSGKPVTERIDEYQNPDIPIHIWDTVGLELNAETTRKSIDDIKKVIALKTENKKDLFDRIHAIWYCINSGSNRYQDAELAFIKELHSIGVPFVIVLTQCSGDEEEVNRFEDAIRERNNKEGMTDISIVQVLAKPVKFRGIATPISAFGLEELVNVTLKKLPDFIKGSFIAAQRQDLSLKRGECEKIIYRYVKAAYNGFWDKVPLINVFTTDKKIMEMFKEIGSMYNKVLTEEAVERVFKDCNVNFPNNFWGLISPIDMGYSKKIAEKLTQKKKDGFTVEAEEFIAEDRAARMIAFYGYTFIDAIEKLWTMLTENQLKDVEMVVRKLAGIINEFLKKRESEVKKKEK